MPYHPYIQPDFHKDNAPLCAVCGKKPQHPDHDPGPEWLTRVATSPHKADTTPEGDDNETDS